MFRHIVTFAVVLSVVMSVQAEFFITVDGVVDPPDDAFTLFPGDNVDLGIFGTNENSYEQIWVLIVQGPGSITNGTILHNGQFNELITMPAEHWGDNFDWDSFGFPGATSASQISLVSAPDEEDLNGILVDQILFHCDGLGEVLLTLYDLISVEPIVDTQTIHQVIPEPATLSLLALGGWAAMRRKRTS